MVSDRDIPFEIGEAGSVLRWTSPSYEGFYEMWIDKFEDGLIHTRSIFYDRIKLKIREPWAMLTSIATYNDQNGIIRRHEVLEGNLPEIAKLRVGRACTGRVRETQSTGLCFDWDVQLEIIDKSPQATFDGTQDVFVIEEKRKAPSYWDHMILHYAPELKALTYYETHDSKGYHEVARVIK